MSPVMRGHGRWDMILSALREQLRRTLRECRRLLQEEKVEEKRLKKLLKRLGTDYGNACFLRGRLGYGSNDRLEREAFRMLLTMLALAYPENREPPGDGLPGMGPGHWTCPPEYADEVPLELPLGPSPEDTLPPYFY